jgi:hypothetical protein
MFQNESNRLAKIRQTFFTRLPLAISSRYLGAVRDVPGTILFDGRRELVVHEFILPTLRSHAAPKTRQFAAILFGRFTCGHRLKVAYHFSFRGDL